MADGNDVSKFSHVFAIEEYSRQAAGQGTVFVLRPVLWTELVESLEEEKDRPQAFILGLRRDRSAISNPCDVFRRVGTVTSQAVLERPRQ